MARPGSAVVSAVGSLWGTHLENCALKTWNDAAAWRQESNHLKFLTSVLLEPILAFF